VGGRSRGPALGSKQASGAEAERSAGDCTSAAQRMASAVCTQLLIRCGTHLSVSTWSLRCSDEWRRAAHTVRAALDAIACVGCCSCPFCSDGHWLGTTSQHACSRVAAVFALLVMPMHRSSQTWLLSWPQHCTACCRAVDHIALKQATGYL
jgi:hypothetical protein